jgi:hypothetical protein
MKRESGAQIQLRTTKEAHNETSTVMAVLACITSVKKMFEILNKKLLHRLIV